MRKARQATTDALRLAEEKATEHLAGWQRAHADYENLRKRMERELAAANEAGQDALLQELLPILDALDAGAAAVPDDLRVHPWAAGVLQTTKALHACLEKMGVTRVAETGVPLDPARHEAVAERPSELPPGTVIEVVARGILRGGRVLRPAKVTISAGPRASTE